MTSRFKQFCESTSLHGFKFYSVSNFSPGHVFFWTVVITTSIVSSAYIMKTHVEEFFGETVSYNLESPTVPLDDVFFPSVTICNMNALRKSFIQFLMTDPVISGLATFSELWKLVDGVYITGGKEDLSGLERQIVKAILESPVYDELYQEFVNGSIFSGDIPELSNVFIAHWHAIEDIAEEERNSILYKEAYLPEIASQFRIKDGILRMNFNGVGINHDGGGFSTDVSETCHWLTPFVKMPEDMYDLRTTLTSARNGVNNGLLLLLDAESYDYASTKYGGEGFTVSVLHHLDIPIMKHTGVSVEPGQSSHISVTPTLMTTSAGARRRFSPVERQCYFQDEIELFHFPPVDSYRYEMSNCLFESTIQKIERECKCVPKNFLYLVPDLPVCEGQKKKCMNLLKQTMGDSRHIVDRGETKVCLAACVDQKHNVLVTTAAYPNLHSFVANEDFCVVFEKLLFACNGDRKKSLGQRHPGVCDTVLNEGDGVVARCKRIIIGGNSKDVNVEERVEINRTSVASLELQKAVYEYARHNIAKVSIFLRDPYVNRYVREEKITEITFVGTVGGLFGLFLGFSFISVIEIMYLSFMWALDKAKTMKASDNKDETDVKLFKHVPIGYSNRY